MFDKNEIEKNYENRIKKRIEKEKKEKTEKVEKLRQDYLSRTGRTKMKP